MPDLLEKLAEKHPSTVPMYTVWDAARYLDAPTWLVGMMYGYFPRDPIFVFEYFWHRGHYPFLDGEMRDASPRISFDSLASGFVHSSLYQSTLEITAKRDYQDRLHENLWRTIVQRGSKSIFESDASEGIERLISGLPNETSQHMKKKAYLYMDRVEITDGIPTRLFPFSRDPMGDAPRAIVIDPQIGLGKPTLVGRGIATEALFDRFQAGDSPEELADDYSLSINEVDEAVRFESRNSLGSFPFLYNL